MAVASESSEKVQLRKWWTETAPGTTTSYRLVNGVFKGGGAKGAAYAGALEAVARNGIWFGAVAGASAGAITAALIAAGLPPTDLPTSPSGQLREPTTSLGEATTSGLATIKPRLVHAVLGVRDSVFKSEGLHEWLAGILRVQCDQPDDDHLVTFQELFVCTEIELFVIAMDLSSKAPVVFHHATTPDAAVASAVVASCAIPGAFSSGRMAVDADDYVLVDQLVDGGSWANFPHFVFKDPQFRAWLKQRVANFDADGKSLPTSTLMLGFVLDDDLAREPPRVLEISEPKDCRRVSELDRGSAVSSGSEAQYAAAKLLGTTGGRLALVAALGAWLWLTFTAYPEASRRWTARLIANRWPIWPLVAYAAMTSIVVAALLAGTFVTAAVVFGRTLSKTVVPSAAAALGVATGTPPWIGERANNTVVIAVPAHELTTLSFGAPEAVVSRVTERARWHVADELWEALSSPEISWATPFEAVPLDVVKAGWNRPPLPADPTDTTKTSAKFGQLDSWGSALSLVCAVVAALCFGFSFYLLERSTYGGALAPNQSRVMGCTVAVVALGVAVVGRNSHRRVLIRLVACSFALLGLVIILSEGQTFRKLRYFAVAGAVAVLGVVALFGLTWRGARKAHQRACDRPIPNRFGLLLGTVGLVVAASACLAIYRLGIDAEEASRPAVLISASSKSDGGVRQVFCLDRPAIRTGCSETTTINGKHSTYRIGDRVLVRPLHGGNGFQIVIAPEAIPLLFAIVALLVGIGCVVSGAKRYRFRARLERRTVSPP